jgi:hypothetical protein
MRTALVMLTVLGAGSAAAQTRPEDLPPPLAALGRSLETTSGRYPGAASDADASLSKPIEIPFTIEGGHIVIQASIDGGSPKPFMFDTGARITIMPDVARPMNAAVERTGRAAGIGSKISHIDIIKVGRIAIGAATLEQPTVGVLDMPNIIVDRGSRPRLAGLIGSELLARYAVTIDYSRRLLTLNTPGFRPQSAAFPLPLAIS